MARQASPHNASPKTSAPQPGAKPPFVGRRPSAATIGFLLGWHGMMAGAFIVAMLSGQGAYSAHSFAGVVMIVAIGIRLAVGAAFPKGHLLTFPWPSFKSLAQGTSGVYRFVSHTMGVVMLGVCSIASLTGWFAWSAAEAHAVVSYFALSVIGVHLGLVILMQGVKKVQAFARSRA